MDGQAQQAGQIVTESGGNMDEAGDTPQLACNQADEIIKGLSLRPNGIDRDVSRF